MNKVQLEIIEFVNKGDIDFETKKKAINANNLNSMQKNTNDALNKIQDNMIYFTESTTLNDLIIKSNLLGNNSKINASEIAVVKNNEVKTLDDYLDNINAYSTEEKIIGKDENNKDIYRKVFKFQVSSLARSSRFDINIPNVLEFQKYECSYLTSNALIDLPYISNNNPSTGMSARLHFESNNVNYIKLYGNQDYGETGTFKVTVEYTKTTD